MSTSGFEKRDREKLRDKIIKKRSKAIAFRRTNWFKFKRVGEFWRKPRGDDSKIKRKVAGHPPMPSPGYRSPADVRGLHPSGFPTVVVHNVAELLSAPSGHAIYISSTVGRRKREEIIAKAEELKLKLLNAGK
ncbi:MAG: 50S ribosomal protein L32e [Candidatus Marsarchaeota archaeon]